MDNTFILEVVYDNKILSFDARLSILGYSHKFYIEVNGSEVVYEPDEEGRYRAIIPAGLGDKYSGDRELLRVIGETIEAVFS